MDPKVASITETEKNHILVLFSEYLPGLHVSDSSPVGSEEVSGDDETYEVADHDDTDDEVEIKEFRGVDE